MKCGPRRRQFVPEILQEPDLFIFVQEVGGGSGGGGKLLAHKSCGGGSTSCYVQARYAVASSAYVSIRQHTSEYCQHTCEHTVRIRGARGGTCDEFARDMHVLPAEGQMET
jgi:hypothetical protein